MKAEETGDSAASDQTYIEHSDEAFLETVFRHIAALKLLIYHCKKLHHPPISHTPFKQAQSILPLTVHQAQHLNFRPGNCPVPLTPPKQP